MNFTAHEVQIYYSSKFPNAPMRGTKDWRMPCPIHSGTNPNFSINPSTGLSQCHSTCGRGWDMISLEQELTGLDFVRAKERVFELVGRPKVEWEEREFESVYDYTDESGKVVYQVIRKVGKKFSQRKPNGSGGWEWGIKGVPRVPFHLPKVRNSEFVAIVEGEKDVLTLERIGMVATCNNGGAGNFNPELAEYFSGKHVAIFADNDNPGREHALKVARLLISVVKSIKIVELPKLPEKGDVTDFVNSGGTIEQIRDSYKLAQAWNPEWQFSCDVPSENDKYVRSFRDEVESAGGLTAFWDLAQLKGLETPWRKLSRILGGGMRNGEYYVLGGNQGSGKTSLALQFIIAAIRRAEGVLMFSMEMGWRDVYQRMAAMEARVDLNEFREHQFTLRRRDSGEIDRTEAQKALGPMMLEVCRRSAELVEMPILVSTKSSVTPDYIIEEATRLATRINPKLVVVDHMQLMASSGSERGDYEKFTAISRVMKHVAKTLDAPVLVVSQTNRSQAKEHRQEVEVADLRGSGAIEEDAAAVMLLFEDHDDKIAALQEGERYTKGPVKTILKVGKNRYGQQGGRAVQFHHHKTITRFELYED